MARRLARALLVAVTTLLAVTTVLPAHAANSGAIVELLSIASARIIPCIGENGLVDCVEVTGTAICTTEDQFEGDLDVWMFSNGHKRTPVAAAPDESDSSQYCTGEIETWQALSYAVTTDGRIHPGRYEIFVFFDSYGETGSGLDTMTAFLAVKPPPAAN